MPGFNEHDRAILEAIEHWRLVAGDEVEDIGGWRQDTAKRALHGGWPEEPDGFYTLTSYLCGRIRMYHPTIAPVPLEAVYLASRRWHADRNAKRIPAQASLEETLALALKTLQSVQQAIIARLEEPGGKAALARSKSTEPAEATRREAENLAVEVEALWRTGNNRRIFAKQIQAFWDEVEERIAERGRKEKAEADAIRAIRDEARDVAAGKAQPRLTAEEGKGPPGWERILIDLEGPDAGPDDPGVVWGHVPLDVAAYRAKKSWTPRDVVSSWTLNVPLADGSTPLSWGDEPSDTVVFALLAALRDTHLRHLAPILASVWDFPLRVVVAPLDLPGAAAFDWVDSVTSGARPDGLAEARTFLARAREYLSTPHGKGPADKDGKAAPGDLRGLAEKGDKGNGGKAGRRPRKAGRHPLDGEEEKLRLEVLDAWDVAKKPGKKCQGFCNEWSDAHPEFRVTPKKIKKFQNWQRIKKQRSPRKHRKT